MFLGLSPPLKGLSTLVADQVAGCDVEFALQEPVVASQMRREDITLAMDNRYWSSVLVTPHSFLFHETPTVTN